VETPERSRGVLYSRFNAIKFAEMACTIYAFRIGKTSLKTAGKLQRKYCPVNRITLNT
jgi:hypothetical protein